MFGTLFVLLGFSVCFLRVTGFDLSAHLTAFYTTFEVLYNIGYASAQTSHLAMIPELSPSEELRTSLTLIRNSMTAFANILAYSVALIAFSYGTKNYY